MSAEAAGGDPGGGEAGRGYGPVLAVALGLRVLWGLAVPVVPVSDCAIYDLLARNIAAGLGYSWEEGVPTAYWPVGTSAVYGFLYKLFGVRYEPVVAFNVVVGVGVVGLTMVLAGRWFGPRVGRVAGWLTACWPVLVAFTTVLGSELLFLAAMLGAWAAWTAPGWRLPARVVAAGVGLAAASYVRPTALLLPGVFALGEMVRQRRLFAPAYQAALVGGVMALCFAPWVVRNQRVFGEFLLISANGGANAWMGNSPGTTGFYRDLPPLPRPMNELERDRYLGGLAKAYIRQDPVGFVKRSAVKLVRLHERESIGVSWNQEGLERRLPPRVIWGIKLGSNVYWWGMLGLGVAGFAVLARRLGLVEALLHPAVLVWGYFAAVHAATVIQDRYHMAAIPSIAALAALAVTARRGAATRLDIETSA